MPVAPLHRGVVLRRVFLLVNPHLQSAVGQLRFARSFGWLSFGRLSSGICHGSRSLQALPWHPQAQHCIPACSFEVVRCPTNVSSRRVQSNARLKHGVGYMKLDSSNPVPRFTWLRFAKSLVTQCVIVGALEWYWFKSSGKWDSSNFVVVLVVAWLNIFLAYRWRLLRREQSIGIFSEEEYRADPSGYIFGSIKQRRLAIAVGVAIVVVYAITSVSWGHE
jgi:hypothetical protein